MAAQNFLGKNRKNLKIHGISNDEFLFPKWYQTLKSV
jgi:hypothetical protein